MNILGFGDHGIFVITSVATEEEAAIDNGQSNRHGCMAIKLYLQNHTVTCRVQFSVYMVAEK